MKFFHKGKICVWLDAEGCARLTRDAMLGSDPRFPGETANGYKVRVPS